MTTTPPAIGLLGVGEMGAALASAFRTAGATTFTVASGRSAQTRQRIDEAGITTVPDRKTLLARADIVFSVLPPEVAEAEGRACANELPASRRPVIFVEANAISPRRLATIAQAFENTGAEFVDAGIVGGPPTLSHRPRLYTSGPQADALKQIDGSGFDRVHLGPDPGQASAFKMVYAAMTKGINTLLTTGYLAAEQFNLSEEFSREFSTSQPDFFKRAETTIARLPADAGRWIFEMREIADTLEEIGLPDGFHRAAAQVMTLLDGSEFGHETRRTRDRTRTAAQTVKALSAGLSSGT